MSKNTPEIRFNGYSEPWNKKEIGEWGNFYYGHSCPKWSVTEDADIPCIRYGELYSKFENKIDTIFSYTNMSKENLRFSKGNEVLIPRVGEDPMDYNHCAWLSIPNVAIGEMISVYNTKQDPLFTATMFNATLQKDFAVRVEGGSVTNLYYEKLKEIIVSFPEKKEQEIIGILFEKIQKLIVEYEHEREKLLNNKKAMLEKMFPKEGCNVPEIRFKGFDKSWKKQKLIEAAKYRNGKAHENCIDENGKYIVVNSKFVSTNGEIRKFSNMQNEPLYKNEIAFVLSDVPNGRAIARTFLVDESGKYTLNQRIAGITPLENTYPYFLHILMNRHPYFLAFDDGAKQTNLTVQDVLDFEAFYPEYEEQKKIGEYFAKFDELIMNHQQELEKLKNIKAALLEKMFV